MTAWAGNRAGHAAAGRLGGMKQGRKTNPSNFANNRKAASEAGKKGAAGKWGKPSQDSDKQLIKPLT